MDKKIDKKSMESGNIFRGLTQRQVEGGSLGNQADASPNATHSYEFVRDHGSLLSLQPWIFRKETDQGDEDKMRVNGGLCERWCSHGLDRLTDASQSELSPRNVSLGYGWGKGRSSLKSRRSHRYSVKPVASVGNCLIPQLYNEHFALEEYVSTVPIVRPLIITDGSRIISKSTYGNLGMPFKSGFVTEGDGITSGQMETVVGVPPLPQFRSPKQKSRDQQHQNLETSSSPRRCNVSHSQDSPSRMLLFFLGINVGVTSTIISNRREIERLSNVLNHTENLVQDLQEELDMKDAVTVKELNDEALECQRLDNSCEGIEGSTELPETQVPAFCPTQETDDRDQRHPSNTVDIGEFSRIEAELEAELERLELNMNTSSLEGKLSALGELDPDLIADVVQGELRADMLNGGDAGGKGEANRDSSTSTGETCNVNYAVSPRELSLRLHEVIQFRLEERIEELESALRHSQKQVEFMKAERALSQSQRAFSISETGSYSDPESPTLSPQNSASAQPLCLNLTGDALHAYGEAYEEFMRITDTHKSSLSSTTGKSKDVYGDGLLQPDDRIPAKECSDKGGLSVDSRPFRSVSMDSSDIESNDSDDEEAKMLIQQIVERTRNGSPAVVMHAQRMLLAMDE